MKILVVEDEEKLANIIKRGLTEEGYCVDVAYDGESGEDYAKFAPYDLIILDIMLPKKDGITLCKNLREEGINVPILMLTAKDSIEDRVKGLDSGADDYLVKPFDFNELFARVRSLLRRESFTKNPKLQVGDLVLDTLTREVWKGDKKIKLTPKEYNILEYFMRNPKIVVTRTMLEEKMWDLDFEGSSNVIDVYIRRLRKKIDDKDGSIIETVRGAGYRLRAS
ncbi:response regulator transcription factor [Petrotoga sp. 9PWA.NaAc.5.4]|uniref:response regulator transcription factor n=1 Tax=Petrotoga sp. 9PWA.NaAc.5.4 TaxID=1434328 RepID=UPI000CB663B1|nr:response regulator transcription factor [Petrotoga sp. 9PWA.NaAc.5.4]PNR96728.1 PhoB family transcriptional regulator [Petrotoga sp. 9PWA.NaAc.5.4]